MSSSSTKTSSEINTPPPPSTHVDDLVRLFNTALVSSRVDGVRDFSAELAQLVESPAFRCILASARQLSKMQSISEREAAEQIIRAFRKAERIWDDYLFQEGLDRLKGTKPNH